MRIEQAALNTYHNSLLLPQERSSTRASGQDRLKTAVDSYSGNAASASVIEAEYIEESAPGISAKITPQGPSQLNSAFPTFEITPLEPQQTAAKRIPSVYNQAKTGDTPLPGTYLNIFA